MPLIAENYSHGAGKILLGQRNRGTVLVNGQEVPQRAATGWRLGQSGDGCGVMAGELAAPCVPINGRAQLGSA